MIKIEKKDFLSLKGLTSKNSAMSSLLLSTQNLALNSLKALFWYLQTRIGKIVAVIAAKINKISRV